MLKILELGFMCATICAFPTIIGFFENSEERRIGTGITLFALDFMWMTVFLYTSCNAQTYWTMAMWIWPALILNFIIRGCQNAEDIEGYTIITLFLISIIIFVVSIIVKPVQNLIYVHDTENIDMAYTISSDEILARVDVSIMDGNALSKNYSVDSPEIRKIEGKDKALYHISAINETKYIPGYIIMEKDKNPKIIQKRLYFDPSYENGKDALRTVRRECPNVYIGEAEFDIDDDYNIYRVYEYREKLFRSNGKDYGLITINLFNGEVKKYPEEEIPDWVDFKTTKPR